MTGPDALRDWADQHLQGVRPARNGWLSARCPAHDDQRASLQANPATGGCRCLAGCEPTDLWALARAAGLPAPPDLRPAPDHSERPQRQQWVYWTADGTHHHRVTRVDRPGQPKAYYQARWDGRAWVKGAPDYTLPYRLPELAAADRSGPVLWVEGELCADLAGSLGLQATTSPGGAQGLGRLDRQSLTAFRGRQVVILPDHDDPGRDYARRVRDLLMQAGARPRILDLADQWPGNKPRKGDDLADWLRSGGTSERLRDLLAIQPDSAPAPNREAILPMKLAPKDGAYTDRLAAEVLIAQAGDRLRYIPKWARWLVWRDDHWAEDPGDVLATEMAASTVAGALPQPDGSDRGEWAAYGRARCRAESAVGVRALLHLARGIDGVPLDHEALDSNPWLLGVRGGVVDLRIGTFRQAVPADLISRQCPALWTASASCPTWDRCLEQWHPDPLVRDYLHRLVGAALIGEQRDHLMVIHYGSGSNGKGCFTRALQALLGPYCVTPDMSLLVEQKHESHPTAKAHLFRARLAVASETKDGTRLAEASVKALTGGDRIQARRMHQDPWEFTPTHSLWLCCNHLPRISGRDHGVWRRLRVVPWTETLQPVEGLEDRLRDELPGILQWAVRGVASYLQRGLAEPEAVIRATLAYRASEDVFARLAGDLGLRFESGLQVDGADLMAQVGEWATAQGTSLSPRAVARWLTEGGARSVRVRSGNGTRKMTWQGVGFVAQPDPDLYSVQGGQSTSVFSNKTCTHEKHTEEACPPWTNSWTPAGNGEKSTFDEERPLNRCPSCRNLVRGEGPCGPCRESMGAVL